MSFLSNTKLYSLAQAISGLDEGLIFEIVFNKESIKNEIIRLNTQEQLFKKGIGADGLKLTPPYTANTVRLKRLKGQRTDHVTLKDTEDFYKSFRVSVNKVTIEITADTIKEGNDLIDKYGDEILGLTDESKEKLSRMALIEYIKYWQENLLR